MTSPAPSSAVDPSSRALVLELLAGIYADISKADARGGNPRDVGALKRVLVDALRLLSRLPYRGAPTVAMVVRSRAFEGVMRALRRDLVDAHPAALDEIEASIAALIASESDAHGGSRG